MRFYKHEWDFLLSCQDFEWSASGLVIWAIILSVLIINSAAFRAKIRKLQPTCSSLWQCVVVFLFSTVKKEHFFGPKVTPANTSTHRKFDFLGPVFIMCQSTCTPQHFTRTEPWFQSSARMWDWPKSTAADCCGSRTICFSDFVTWFTHPIQTKPRFNLCVEELRTSKQIYITATKTEQNNSQSGILINRWKK